MAESRETADPPTDDPTIIDRIERLCTDAFGPDRPSIGGLEDANLGRGAFSTVVRVRFDRTHPATGDDLPPTVVAKLPIRGPNGRAAITAGAYRREADAYRAVLPRSPVRSPELHAVDQPGDGTCSLLLADLGDRRHPDQLDGLDAPDAIAVAQSLARFHRAWSDGPPAQIEVRRNTVAQLPHEAVRAGLTSLDRRWPDAVGPTERKAFARLVDAHADLAARFDRQPSTLCHGDPRADNLFFDHDGQPILLDWQQMAVQFGAADLAWLAATSLEPAVRRAIEPDLVAAAGATMARYRLGLALPGLAVLLLAQRDFTGDRSRRLVACSLQRIAAALIDHDPSTTQ